MKKNKKSKKDKKKDDDEKKEEEKKEPPKPETVKLFQTSIYDILQAIEKMQDYDFTLHELGIITGNIEEELMKEG